jgi:hypothetical protein
MPPSEPEERLKLSRFSLAAMMTGVLLVAIDLAALQHLYTPTNTSVGNSHFLIMSIMPMINILVIVGFRCSSRLKLREEPFFLGFLAAGIAASLGHIACDRMFPDAMFRLYSVPFQPFYRFTRDYFPWCIGARADHIAYWRYYALLSVFYCWPQFLVAALGGLMTKWLVRAREPQALEPRIIGNDELELARTFGRGTVTQSGKRDP